MLSYFLVGTSDSEANVFLGILVDLFWVREFFLFSVREQVYVRVFVANY